MFESFWKIEELIFEPLYPTVHMQLANSTDQARNQGGGIWGICSPPKISKLPKNKDEILYSNIFKKSFIANFSLSYWLVISLSIWSKIS